MKPRRFQSEAMMRAQERRRREDDAPRLLQQVSGLKELELHFEEYQGDGEVLASRHIRHVVVDRAPALFEVPCQEPKCRDGGHDLTQEIRRALRASTLEFDGEDRCRGTLGTSECHRILRFVGRATYADRAGAEASLAERGAD
jgi:hypothetical protein